MTCRDCGRERGTSAINDGSEGPIPVGYCWRDAGVYGNTITLIDCLRAQLQRERENGDALRAECAAGIALLRRLSEMEEFKPWHLVTTEEEEGYATDEWGCMCGANADTEAHLAHALDCSHSMIKNRIVAYSVLAAHDALRARK